MPAGVPRAPPPSPSAQRIKQGGLVSGTGRLKHVKRRQFQLQHPQPPQPIPQQPHPSPPSPALTPREQFAQYYGFTLPPPPPVQEDPDEGYPYEYGRGIVKSPHFPASIANSASSSSTSSTSSSSNSSSSSSDRWDNPTSYPQPSVKYRTPPPPPQFRRSTSCRVSSSTPTCLPPLEHDELMAKFNDQFVHSRTQSASDLLASPTKRERSIVPAGAEGKLCVPDVKLKVRCSSSASIESAASRRTPSRQSPLSAPITINEFGKRDVVTSLTLKRPSFETRAWSYDNVTTYPIMQLPARKEKRIVKQIVDGEETDVEIEVDVFDTPKKLFLFAPKVVLR